MSIIFRHRDSLLRLAYCALSVIMIFSAPASFADSGTPSYSDTIFGTPGLNTVPSARMHESGTISAGISTLDPYLNAYLGFQLAPPLQIVLRQSAETSSLKADPDNLYPGIDLKLRLLDEGPWHPAAALGIQSAIGHKRMAAEYLTLSKRYKSFDFTAGIGWGRMGSAGQLSNPFGALGSHFSDSRPADGDMPGTPARWFTGKDAGFFGGLEYFVPYLHGLSLKFDYSADRFRAETSRFDYHRPAPWSAGLSYGPWDWVNFSIAAQGRDKIMGRISLQAPLQNWFGPKKHDPVSMRRFRAGVPDASRMAVDASGDGILLTETNLDGAKAETDILLKPGRSLPAQIGRAAVFMANHGGPGVEKLTLRPTMMGLRGPSVSLMRADLEHALTDHRGSAEEIWRHTEFGAEPAPAFRKLRRPIEWHADLHDITLLLDNHISLSEEDNGILYRSSIVGGSRGPVFFGLLDSGFSARVNLADNLQRLHEYRPYAFLPVRSDIDEFANNQVFSVDTLYTALTHSFTPALHVSFLSGYLEEMYAGYGGEILYRPFKSRFAFGGEIWRAFKRAPYTIYNLGLNGDRVLTGDIKAWYDVPHLDLTLNLKIGRYLNTDTGFTAGIEKRFKNGAALSGFFTLTDQADFDIFGGTTHAYSGVRLILPLGGIKYMPEGAAISLRAEPMGRDAGQSLEPPVSLYDLTEPFSYSHIIRHWDEVTD